MTRSAAGPATTSSTAGRRRHLSGSTGNDVIYAGPGRNKIGCGPGNDTAYIGPGDTVRDCEHVHRS
jgi:Hemolysin-type calcium-binding repeat (2 copies).